LPPVNSLSDSGASASKRTPGRGAPSVPDQAIAESERAEQLDGRMLEHAGADALWT
jgi:hypothetical protein